MRSHTVLCIFLIIFLNDVFGKLRLVNVLFRHGDRTPGNFIRTYKNEHQNNTFYPFGRGGLTNQGKQRVYKLGKNLRKTYDEFLGSVYLTEEIEALSSGSPRARMSLQMVLTGLFPPAPIQKWNDDINWQPALMLYKPREEDKIFVPQLCEMYKNEYERVQKSKEFQKEVSKLRAYMKQLAVNMGRDGPIPVLDMNHLFHTLAAEKAMNLTLPAWVEESFPNGKLRAGALLQYHLYGFTDKLRRLAGGILLEKMIKDMRNIEAKVSPIKMHLYSGHELNIVMLLQTFGLYDDIMPEFSSAMIIELHEILSEFFIKVLYYHGISQKKDVLTIPNCSEFCHLDRFINLLANVTPSLQELECKRIK